MIYSLFFLCSYLFLDLKNVVCLVSQTLFPVSLALTLISGSKKNICMLQPFQIICSHEQQNSMETVLMTLIKSVHPYTSQLSNWNKFNTNNLEGINNTSLHKISSSECVEARVHDIARCGEKPNYFSRFSVCNSDAPCTVCTADWEELIR